MDEINFIFQPFIDAMMLNAGCCCSIIIPEGFAYGPKLTIIIEKPDS